MELRNSLLVEQVSKRRTFAIISHPDAGKTTLTEKLLLYSGMIRTAGMVRARKGSKGTSSDWMGMEQERGISITASAMQFPYKDAIINVLDTPGHQDFSEDTYRTLTAADSAIMVLDASKGVEVQTRKLFHVCKMRGIPILTFINKMDLPGKDPLDLMHELEEVLGIHAAPLNWPIGYGREFIGVMDLRKKSVMLFSKGLAGGAERAAIETIPAEALKSDEKRFDKESTAKLLDDLELLSVAGNPFSQEAFLKGEITPVFFGSALTNFGVEPFFDSFVELAPSPRAAVAIKGEEKIQISPTDPAFSGFVFKIQANMNPKHRDSMAFIRVCSGKFERDMIVKHHRSGKEPRLARSYSMVARDRSTVDEAFAGDIVGVTNPGLFAIGDTLSTTGGFDFPPMPRFAPELIARVRPLDVLKRKAFEKGMDQLGSEGTIQILEALDGTGIPYVAAVGKLQFDVLQYRLKDEYGVEVEISMLPYSHCAFLVGDPATFKKTQSSVLARDRLGRILVLFSGEWERRYCGEQNPGHSFEDLVI